MAIQTTSLGTGRGAEPTNTVLVSRGWNVLVENLGYADATHFIMLIDKGSGDAVKYFRELWSDASAQEIYKQVVAQREKRNK